MDLGLRRLGAIKTSLVPLSSGSHRSSHRGRLLAARELGEWALGLSLLPWPLLTSAPSLAQQQGNLSQGHLVHLQGLPCTERVKS